MLLFLRAFLPSHAATAAYGVLKVRSFTLLAESTPTVSQSLSVYKWWLKMGRCTNPLRGMVACGEGDVERRA